MLSLSDLIDPSFQAFVQVVLDTASLDVRSWARLALVSHDMRACVNHVFSQLTRAHIEDLLRCFPNGPNAWFRVDDTFSTFLDKKKVHGELVWARDWIDGVWSNRLVRIGYHLYKETNDQCHTLVALMPSGHAFCQHSNFVHLPILNPGLELAVARMTLKEGEERMPKRRKL